MLAMRSECAKRALLCLLNLVIVLESCVAVLVFDQSAHWRSSNIGKSKQPSALMSLWLGAQYASFGASVVFAAAVWLSQRSRALVLLANALFFALYGLQWLALALCTLLAGYSTSAALFAALSLHPLVGFVLSRASGRQARDEAERQEALEIVFAHEESLYHRAEA